MVGYSEYEKGYNLFYHSSHKIFIKISVQFEEEHMQEVELVEGGFSHPPLNDDVSDVYLSDFYDSDMEDEYDEMHSYHGSPIRPNWANKTIQAAGDLVEDPLGSRKNRSQFHNAFSTCDSNIPKRFFMIFIFFSFVI